jgi:hypothetical protein
MYKVIKDYEPHAFKVGDIVAMNEKFAKKLIKDKIIKPAKAEKE